MIQKPRELSIELYEGCEDVMVSDDNVDPTIAAVQAIKVI